MKLHIRLSYRPRVSRRLPLVLSFRSSRFGLCLTLTALATLVSSANAQEATPSAPADGTTIDLDAITVTATKAGERVYESLSASSVIDRERIETQIQPSSTADVLRLIPSVATQSAPGDPGIGINVRGLQDFGRVNVLVDGARQNFQREGHSAKGTFYFDPEMMKSVDVTRGPASSIYGSGAIGGVVSFTTIDAGDVLPDGAHVGGRVKGAWETNGNTPLLHGEVAARPSAMFDLLGAATWRNAGDYRSGDGSTVDYTAQELLSGLFKTRIRPTSDQELMLSALRITSDFENGLSTLYRTQAVADTFTAGYRWTPDSPIWDLSAKVYFSGTNVKQTTLEGITAGAVKTFDIGTVGLDLFNTSRFDAGAFRHELTYGGDLFQDNVETKDPFGVSDKLTPSGERLVYGAFIQDRVMFSEWLEVIGALRYDSYRLTDDDIENEGSRLSPKITVGITPWQPVTFYASYAEGYRAPALTETLIDGFHPPPLSAGRFFPNPNLKPEIAHNIEGGVNLRFDNLIVEEDRLRMKLGIFHNRVDDYIEQVFTRFPIPGGYQYRNIAEAVIDGFEAEGIYDAGSYFFGVAGHVLRGRNSRTNEDLVKVPPNRLTTTLGFRRYDGRIEFGTRVSLVGAKDNAEGFGFVGDPYAVIDLFANWRASERVTAGLIVENLFDRQYTEYLNGNPSPGFSAKASLSVKLY
ncbi:TonB-dependent hemoglobin/transferrin/lactoferrin family receptor [Microvirga sp. VF16]|uniref:TonB-dependent hemoglobin/transferrin/lactoferrin family receptor n=1 Tax=Microvirga sp. VF16 TaxID=2807101 RepID=UPI00193DD9EB|nr:TonB-dependent hemoglobin/transferrin/lactoferrin family receptor [Microvirga sp. VF16]QRM30306.1 TonB-dependent hemoglobin/transferrin/lactoferrin family receptor [Microvirga sp. VF16]